VKRLLRLPSTYFGLPLLLACGITLLSYDLSADYMQGLILLAVMAVAVILLDLQLGIRLPPLAQFRLRHYAGTRDAFVALVFAGAIVLFCMLDVALFPPALFNKPSAYAVMEGGHEHVRHVSDMCWVLPPIALLCTRNRWLRHALVFVGIAFPILVIDRNRIFASLFAFAVVILLRRDEARPLPWKAMGLLAVAGAGTFSILGMLRSGSIDHVTLPFSDLYQGAPQGIKWLLLYGSAGPYNFSAMLAKHYSNADFLFNQLVPMSGSISTVDTGIPLDASNINVGTEFFPFLMAWGPLGAIGSMFALYAWLLWSVRRLRPGVPLFPLLIFLRMSYVCVMAPFGPQAFTWTNIGFVFICLVMQVFAALLPSRRMLRHPFDPCNANALARH
jgi:hypothetical protein